MKIPRVALQSTQLSGTFTTPQDNSMRVWKFLTGEDVCQILYCESSSLLLTSHFTSVQYSQLELATL